MGDEHGISWPDSGMCASDPKGTFAPKIKRNKLFSISESMEQLKQLREALLDIAEDDCGCCDCAKRAREALGMKGGGL